ncbi:MAG: hypothetical protein ACPGEG_05870 [Salibacteraceae bacterium]
MKLKYILFLFLIALFSNCNKNNADDIYTSIPEVEVDIFLNLNEPSNYNLTYVGGWIYIPGGSRGIIVYRLQDSFIAFERHTPYQSEKTCAFVVVDSTDLYAIDQCSESTFLLLDGSVTKGPAAIPLKRYRTSIQSDVLRVFN